MKHLFFITLIALSSYCLAETVEEGNYVVVRSITKGCEGTVQIDQVIKAEGLASATILNLPEIQVIGKTRQQIGLQIERKIKHLDRQEPTILSISTLKTDRQIESKNLHTMTGPNWDEQCPEVLEELEQIKRRLE